MNQNDVEQMNCPLQVTQELIGGKYKVSILFHLMEGRKRFSQLKKDIPQASGKMLSQQLKEMISDGLISKTVYPTVPVTTEYELTPYGKTLCPIVVAMYRWGEVFFNAQKRTWTCSDADVDAWAEKNAVSEEEAASIISALAEAMKENH